MENQKIAYIPKKCRLSTTTKTLFTNQKLLDMVREDQNLVLSHCHMKIGKAIATKKINNITYALKYTRCSKNGEKKDTEGGKKICWRCKKGHGHGPYWYYTVKNNGKRKTLYQGKKLPAEEQQEMFLEVKPEKLKYTI